MRILVKGITNPFFNKMIRIIEEKAALRGYPLFIQNVDDHVNELDLAISEARGRNLCGVILKGGTFGYTADRFEQLGIPCVLVTVSASEDIPLSLYSSVKINDEKEGYRASEYLISLGHRNIGFIYDPSTDRLTPNRLRYMGYRRALLEHGIEFNPALMAANTDAPFYSGYLTGFNAMKQIYTRCPEVTAVFAFADVLALGARLQGGEAQHIVYDAVLMKRGSCRPNESV